MALTAEWIEAATWADFAEARTLTRKLGGFDVLLCRLGSRDAVAFQNRCTHLGHALDGGRIFGGQLTCPFHGACFDLRSGAALSGPAVLPLRRFALRFEDDRILVQLPREFAGL